MLDSITQNLTAVTSSTEVSNTEVVLAMIVALGLGIIIAATYLISNKHALNRGGFSLTLIMLPIILAVIILFVGSNVARAFSLAGVLSIIRFRSAPGESKDIGYIFFATATGVGCGVGMYLGSSIFVVFMALVLLILERLSLGGKGKGRKLKVIIPEDLNYEKVFDEVFEKYTSRHALQKIKTTDLGSLYEVDYEVTLKQSTQEKEFIDELRVRNGNLNITLTMHGE
ncbi:DUF4956 domain-containing protein [Aminipila luticellarii]|uniref:DUF4956 domain-containing protein n=1 Tax=Aminipila luticellarii TaxID=2507160 RepID=A0A410PX90_9FIRM|nr:DUF4956 domain-containing protein [Aminipila luticellarii]QAT43490.1 DUF4956 domain-containing protein [Aminipila luticellarii]